VAKKETKEKIVKTEKSSSSNFNSILTTTTIRISKETKEKIENLDFVKKHTFDEIMNELMEFYEKNKMKGGKK
jgi:hypothetical protein